MHKNNEAVSASQDAVALCHQGPFGYAQRHSWVATVELGLKYEFWSFQKFHTATTASRPLLLSQHHIVAICPNSTAQAPVATAPCSTALPCPVDLCQLSSTAAEVMPA